LNYLESSHPPDRIVLGLDRVREAALLLDVLPPAEKNLVIAGTNGKGSTAVFAEQLLLAEGHHVGTTLSPHLTHFNERIRIAGSEVTDEPICAALYRIEHETRHIELTYFERVILAALLLFREAHVDVCVLEVGLGGRLDAVNVVDADVSVITSIGLDHCNFLGTDLAAIGAEKAGILRAERPCVLGSSDLPESVHERADALCAPVLMPGSGYRFQTQQPGCAGADRTWSFQSGALSYAALRMPGVAVQNAACALAATVALGIEPRRGSLDRAILNTHIPGRFQRLQAPTGEIILDVAHNAPAARFLGAALDEAASGAEATLAIGGFLRDKDPQSILTELAPRVDQWILVGMPEARGLDMRELEQLAGSTLEPGTYQCDNLDSVLRKIASAAYPYPRIVILGCFRLIEHCLNVLAVPDSEPGGLN